MQSNIPTRTTVFPHAIQQLQTILHTELILPQEISKKYYNYKAHPMQINTRHPPASVPCASKHSTWQNPAIRPLQHKQASSNSTWQKQQSKWQPASTQPLQQFSGKLHKNPLSITEFYQQKQDSFQKDQVLYIHAILRSLCSNLLILVPRIILQEY